MEIINFYLFNIINLKIFTPNHMLLQNPISIIFFFLLWKHMKYYQDILLTKMFKHIIIIINIINF